MRRSESGKLREHRGVQNTNVWAMRSCIFVRGVSLARLSASSGQKEEVDK